MLFTIIEIVDYKLRAAIQYGIHQCELFLRIINRRSLIWFILMSTLLIDVVTIGIASITSYHNLIPFDFSLTFGIVFLEVIFLFCLWKLSSLLYRETRTIITEEHKYSTLKLCRVSNIYYVLMLIVGTFFASVFNEQDNLSDTLRLDFVKTFLFMHTFVLAGFYLLSVESVSGEKLIARAKRRESEGR